MPDALHASALRKTYRAVVALDGVDLRVAAGALVGLLGPDGAGKSTLTKIACGLVRAASCARQPDPARPVRWSAARRTAAYPYVLLPRDRGLLANRIFRRADL